MRRGRLLWFLAHIGAIACAGFMAWCFYQILATGKVVVGAEPNDVILSIEFTLAVGFVVVAIASFICGAMRRRRR